MGYELYAVRPINGLTKLDFLKYSRLSQKKLEELALKTKYKSAKVKKQFQEAQRFNAKRIVEWIPRKFDSKYLSNANTSNDVPYKRIFTGDTKSKTILSPVAPYMHPFIIPCNTNEIPDSKILNECISIYIDYDNPSDSQSIIWSATEPKSSQIKQVGCTNMAHGCRVSTSMAQVMNKCLNKEPVKYRCFPICYGSDDGKSFTISPNEKVLMTEENYKAKFQETAEGKKKWKAKTTLGKKFGGASKLQFNESKNRFEIMYPKYEFRASIIEGNGHNSFPLGVKDVSSNTLKRVEPSFDNAKGILTLNSANKLVQAYSDPTSNEPTNELSYHESVHDQLLQMNEQKKEEDRITAMSIEELMELNKKIRNEFPQINTSYMQQAHNDISNKIKKDDSRRYYNYLEKKRLLVDKFTDKFKDTMRECNIVLSRITTIELKYFDEESLEDAARRLIQEDGVTKGQPKRKSGKSELNGYESVSENDNDNTNDNLNNVDLNDKKKKKEKEKEKEKENENENINDIDLNEIGKKKENENENGSDQTSILSEVDDDGDSSIDSDNEEENLMIASSNSKRKMSNKKKGTGEPPRKRRRLEKQKDKEKLLNEKTQLMRKMRQALIQCPVLKKNYLLDAMRNKMYDSLGTRIARIDQQNKPKIPKDANKNKNKNKNKNSKSKNTKDADASYMKERVVYPDNQFKLDPVTAVK